MSAALPRPRFWTRGRLWGLALGLAITGVFVAANLHLLSVALDSQPDCVAHHKSPTQGAGEFRAAKSSC